MVWISAPVAVALRDAEAVASNFPAQYNPCVRLRRWCSSPLPLRVKNESNKHSTSLGAVQGEPSIEGSGCWSLRDMRFDQKVQQRFVKVSCVLESIRYANPDPLRNC
jgi:hypothetical protein